jgi:hypothetical protein
MEINGGDNEKDRGALEALAEAIRERNLDERLRRIEQTLDLDRFLSFVAMETLLWHWDGYTMNRNNFRIFHDRESSRMVFIPQGMDQILSEPGGPILPRTSSAVARAVLEIPEGRRRYEERFGQLFTNVFNIEAITNRIHQVATKIAEELKENDPEAAERHRQSARGLSRRFQRRAKSLQRRISPVEAIEFVSNKPVVLAEWEPRIDLGKAELTRERDPGGHTLLRISSSDGCTASWRTTAALDSGKYRFEARIRTAGVVFPENDPRAGAGLRVSRHRVGQKHAGDRDWSKVTFDFEVNEDQSEVELVCELRALHGDIWFDSNSLKLTQR